LVVPAEGEWAQPVPPRKLRAAAASGFYFDEPYSAELHSFALGFFENCLELFAMSDHPPGPSSFLGLKEVRNMSRDLLGFSVGLAQRYGDVAAFHVGPVWFYQFTHPDQVQEVLVKQAKKFHKPKRLKQILGKWDGQGLVLSDDELWIRQRRMVQQSFHPRRVQGYAADMTRLTAAMFERWRGKTEVNIVEEFHRLTLDIVCKTLFGVDIDDHAGIQQVVQDVQDSAMLEMGRLIPLPDWLPLASKRRFRNSIGYMKQMIDRIITERRRSREDRGDLLSMMLLAVDSEGDGRGMSDQQARDEAMTLLLAGHETTATTLIWTTYLLAAHADAQAEAAAEVAAVLGERTPTAEDAPRLATLERALKESMRLYPAVYFTSREAIEPLEIAGCKIKPGSQVHLLPYILHRDPRWFADPTAFRPERFTAGFEESLPACAYIPFGAGPRACIGRGMAMMEATMILASLLKRYELRPAAGQGTPATAAQISLHPAGPVRIAIRMRGEDPSADSPNQEEPRKHDTVRISEEATRTFNVTK